jgi:hypothetical protein
MLEVGKTEWGERTAEKTGSQKHSRVQTNEVKNVAGDLKEVHVQKNLPRVVRAVHPMPDEKASDDGGDAVRWEPQDTAHLIDRSQIWSPGYG